MFGFTLATCIWDWYAPDNKLRRTPRGCRKKPKEGTEPTGHLSTDVLCRGLEKNGMVGAWHGHGMASVNQTRRHCVNQMGRTHSKPLAARHGRGMAWARHAMCESPFNRPVYRIKYAQAQRINFIQSTLSCHNGTRCHYDMVRPHVPHEGEAVAVNISNEQQQTADKGWSSILVDGRALRTHRNEQHICKTILMLFISSCLDLVL